MSCTFYLTHSPKLKRPQHQTWTLKWIHLDTSLAYSDDSKSDIYKYTSSVIWTSWRKKILFKFGGIYTNDKFKKKIIFFLWNCPEITVYHHTIKCNSVWLTATLLCVTLGLFLLSLATERRQLLKYWWPIPSEFLFIQVFKVYLWF